VGGYHQVVTLSVVIITFNEEANLPRTLESVTWADEIVVVDSESTDRTVEIAKSYGAKVWIEPWKGFAAQKNSALEKAACDWVLSLDADEEVSPALAAEIRWLLKALEEWQRAGMPMDDDPHSRELRDRGLKYGLDEGRLNGFFIPRQNIFLGRSMRRGGFYPDAKLRFFQKGAARFEARLVHEDARLTGTSSHLKSPLIHHAYPTLSSYIEHMNRYSSLGAEMASSQGKRGFSFVNIVVRPMLTFTYNYIFRLGFLDGREGLLLHLYHAAYVSWKYAKLWELTRDARNDNVSPQGISSGREA
jgi:glycosyltransferase involved in cell wall biosynthesis